MRKNKRAGIAFTSAMSNGELLCAALYIVAHCAILPTVAGIMIMKGMVDEATANIGYYAVGLLFMLLTQWRFLRRDFDPLCDNTFYCALQVFLCFGSTLAFNMVVNTLLSLMPAANPNNAAIISMAGIELGKVTAMAVFMAPIVEEIMFRGLIFGYLRRKSRLAAYLVSALAFSIYHIWAYAVLDPMNLIYAVQYLPVSLLLCLCYERTNSIWGPIFMHMLMNHFSIRALTMLQELM